MLQATLYGAVHLRDPHYSALWTVVPPIDVLQPPEGPGSASLALALAASSFSAGQYQWSLTVVDSLRSVQFTESGTTTINYPPVVASAIPVTVTPPSPLSAMQSVTVATQVPPLLCPSPRPFALCHISHISGGEHSGVVTVLGKICVKHARHWW